MIYRIPTADEPLDQGDLLDGFHTALVEAPFPEQLSQTKVSVDMHRVIILTQACDIANAKTDFVVVASVFDAQQVIELGIVKAADVKGAIRASRYWGKYFLPRYIDAQLNEMIVDFHRLHSIRANVLTGLCISGKRRARLLTPYREHLAKHFADTYSRIGLPQPYETI
jgi:hypothetical protein